MFCADPVALNSTSLMTSPMVDTGTGRAIAGGLLGPIAGIFYLAAGVGLFLNPVYGIAGQLACAGHSLTMVVVVAYHAVYPYTAFIASAQATCMTERYMEQAGHKMSCGILETLLTDHTAYMRTMKATIKFGGIISTLGLLAICAGYRHELSSNPRASPPGGALPWWMALFSPGLWLIGLRESGMLRSLPAPFGVALAGGSFNLAFALFFAAARVAIFVGKNKSKHE